MTLNLQDIINVYNEVLINNYDNILEQFEIKLNEKQIYKPDPKPDPKPESLSYNIDPNIPADIKEKLNIFIEAHKDINPSFHSDTSSIPYNTALEELTKKCKKETHWIWYIFPQPRRKNLRERSIYYSLEKNEVVHYLNVPLLYNHYLKIVQALTNCLSKGKKLNKIVEDDDVKVISSLNLFKAGIEYCHDHKYKIINDACDIALELIKKNK